MSITPRPPIPTFIPESAPFTPEQRTWLNGLFAGLFGLQESVTPLSDADAAKLLGGLIGGAVQPAAEPEDDGAPWHDPAMPLPDRMKLAEGKALPRRLMAAMAQQDCGQCGYNCKDYADALFGKSEKRLNLCVPGGKETSRMLKQLYQQIDSAPGPAVAAEPVQPAPALATPPDARATIRSTPPSSPAAASTSRAPRRRPGTSTSISPAPISIMSSAIRSASFPPTTRSSSQRCSPRSMRRRISHRRSHAARGADRRRLAVAGARHAVRADFVSHRRRTQAESQAASRRRGPGRRCRGPRRARRPAQILRHQARSRSLHRGARSAAAARLFDFLLVEIQSRARFAHRRCRALRDRQAHPARRLLDLPRRPHCARRQDQRSMCRRRNISRCRTIRRSQSS